MAFAAQSAEQNAPAESPASKRQWAALVAVCLASLLMLVDFMAVSVALPAIGRSTGATFAQVQWVL
ncbi:MAG TPA: hypothetical protein VME46_08810, partial [Acidimicrobiales bacterium]|nr:hypothetical protein [Acidimicrobiales bacterium]